MINSENYNSEEIDLLYSLVENAVAEHKSLDMFKVTSVLHSDDLSMIRKENRL